MVAALLRTLIKSCLLLVCLLGLACAVHAAENTAAIQARLAKQLGVKPGDIAVTPVPGLYRVTLGPQVDYVSADGRYFLQGEIIDLRSGANLTTAERAKARLAYLNQLDQSDMIVFAPKHVKRSITVLTDIDCDFCRLLEHDRPALNAMGVEVRYLFYPRDGVDTASWKKAVAVWCAKDHKTAFTAAMQGKPVGSPDCSPAPVAAGYEFGRLLGIDGTPAIITDRGRMIDGYLPLAELASLLGVGSPAAAISHATD